MGWSNAPPPKPPPLGVWEAYDSGLDYHGWLLRCGTVFVGHVRFVGGEYYVSFNGKALGPRKTLDEVKDLVERAIIARVREMLPAYRVIYGRVMHRVGRGFHCCWKTAPKR